MDKMLSKIEGSIGYIIFNNPEKHNAVSLEMWDATDAILDEFESNPKIRVVVLTGAGRKSFVSGADISKFEKERGSAEATKHYNCLLYTSPSPRDLSTSRMPSSA